MAGCTSGGDASAPVDSAPSADLEHPLGLAVIGHSGLTGEGSVPDIQAARNNSWATGMNPDVASIAQRMIERRPETDGQVANAAVGGATAATLAQQAETALARVPVPELMIVQTIDNDIRCDGSDAEHAVELQEQVAAALAVVSEKSPNTKVLLVSQVGRPARHAEMRAEAGTSWPGSGGDCDLFDEGSAVDAEGVARLTDIIVGYERAQLAACVEFDNCHDDEGAGSSFREEWSYMEGGDDMHFNVVGLAALAAHMWPTIESVLDRELR